MKRAPSPLIFLLFPCLACLLSAMDVSVLSLSPYVMSDAGRPMPGFTFPTTQIPEDQSNRTTRPQIEIISLIMEPAREPSWGPDRYVSGGDQQNIRPYVLGAGAVADLKILRDDKTSEELPRCAWLTVVLHPDSASLNSKDSTPRIQAAFPGRVPPNDSSSISYLMRHDFVIWVDGTIDEQGRLIHMQLAPEDAQQLEKIVASNLTHWRFLPARENGQPASAPLRFPIVFVPPNEAASTRQTLACLEMQPGNTDAPAAVPLVWGPITLPYVLAETTQFKAVIDTDGRVASVVAQTKGGEQLESHILAALQSWQFSPAISRGGRSSSELQFGLRAIELPRTDGEGQAPAIPALFTTTVYPRSLVADLDVLNTAQVWGPGKRTPTRTSSASALGSAGVTTANGITYGSSRAAGPKVAGIADIPPRSILATYKLFDGSVDVAYAINTSGIIQNLRILRSSGQPFAVSAVRALLDRRYEPARDAHGEPVSVVARETITFHGNSIFLPILYFQPVTTYTGETPKVEHLAQPIYPGEALSKKKDGQAMAEFTVNPDGRTCRIKIVSASQECFGDALRAALDACEFTPSTRKDQSTPVVLRREETFRIPRKSPPFIKNGQTPSLVTIPMRLDPDESVFSPDAVDVAPKHILKAPPRFPTVLSESSPAVTSGEALIEFTVDKAGNVRDPKIVSATHPAFAYATMQATAGWLFAPAVKGGTQVACRLRLPVTFIAP